MCPISRDPGTGAGVPLRAAQHMPPPATTAPPGTVSMTSGAGTGDSSLQASATRMADERRPGVAVKAVTIRGRDQTEALLRAARESLDLALRTYQSQLPDVTIRHYPDDKQLRVASLPLIWGASHEAALATREIAAFGATGGELADVLGHMRDRRLGIRVLCTADALVTQRGRTRLGELSRRGADVRIAGHTLINDVAVVDRRHVLLCARGGRRTEPSARIIIEAPALARTILDLLARVHAAACRLETFLHYKDPDKAELMIAILGLLNQGRKDAAAARALGLSVRTYRRRVADVLCWLDVSSRFEAGVRAAEMGLVRPGRGRPAIRR